MTVPDFQSMMRPVLALHADGLPHSAADVREDVATVLGVTEEDRQVPLPSGRTTRYANRVAWAVTHMAQALVLERPARGVTQITQRGRDVLTKHRDRVDMSVLAQFPEYLAFRSRTRQPPGIVTAGRPLRSRPMICLRARRSPRWSTRPTQRSPGICWHGSCSGPRSFLSGWC